MTGILISRRFGHTRTGKLREMAGRAWTVAAASWQWGLGGARTGDQPWERREAFSATDFREGLSLPNLDLGPPAFTMIR